MGLKEIRLYGHLGKKFGKSFKILISSPAEAVKALSVNIPGFKEYFIKHSYHIFIDKKDISKDEVGYSIDSNIIKIVPTTMGSGGWFNVIVGIVLIVVGVIIQQPWMVNMGIGMVVSGVAAALFAPPKPSTDNGEKPGSIPSYIFNGAVNTTQQGHPVPICYGRLRIGSQVISAGLSSKEVPI